MASHASFCVHTTASAAASAAAVAGRGVGVAPLPLPWACVVGTARHELGGLRNASWDRAGFRRATAAIGTREAVAASPPVALSSSTLTGEVADVQALKAMAPAVVVSVCSTRRSRTNGTPTRRQNGA